MVFQHDTDMHKRDNLQHWFVLSVTSLGVLLVLLNVGTLNVALPVVSRHFHANSFTANWIILSFLLVNTVLILVFGQVADIFGRKRLYMIGLTGFVATSLLIGLAPNIWYLLVLRCFQAAGGALIITNTTALITDAFPLELLGTGLGINVLVASLAQLLGPVLGGLIASTLGWRWVFWFNVPLGIIGLGWGAITLKAKTPSGQTRDKMDLLGGLMVFLSLGGLIFSLSESSTLGWRNVFVLTGFAAFVVFILAFYFYERRISSPLIDMRLFRNRAYTMANVATLLNFFSTTAVTLLVSLFYEAVHRDSALQAGLKVLPVTIGMLVSSPLAGSLTRKYSARILSTAGMAVSSTGLLLLTLFTSATTPYWLLCIGMLLVGLGFGTFLTPNTTYIMSSVPVNRRGIANGLRSMLNNMGQVLSTAVALMIVTAFLPAPLKDVIYGTATSPLTHADFLQISTAYRYAFAALFIVDIVGIVVSLARGSVQPGGPAQRDDDK